MMIDAKIKIQQALHFSYLNNKNAFAFTENRI